VNPWPHCPNGVEIGASTDGWQFGTLLDGADSVMIYSPDLSRPLAFTEGCSGVNVNKFKWYDTECYMFDQSQLLASTATVNTCFNITVDGTSNLTSTYAAPMFASNGNFFGISTNAAV
jgi:hypothetical protein